MNERLIMVEGEGLRLKDNTADLIRLCRIYSNEAEFLVESALDRETITISEGLFVLKELGII